MLQRIKRGLYHAGIRRRNSVLLGNGSRLKLSPDLAHTMQELRSAGVEWVLGNRPTDDPQPTAWFYNQGVIDVPGGILFYADSFRSGDAALIFTETFLSKIHFPGFNLNGKVIIDAGAFVGDSSLYFASLGATVIALEPNPINFSILERNLGLNPDLAKNIIPLQVALGESGNIHLCYDPLTLGGGSTNRVGHRTKSTVVLSMTLEEIMSRFDLQSAHMLKLDIKGAELPILQSNGLHFFDKLKVEYESHLSGKDLSYYIEILENQGFHTHAYRHNHFGHNLKETGTVYAERRNAPEPVSDIQAWLYYD